MVSADRGDMAHVPGELRVPHERAVREDPEGRSRLPRIERVAKRCEELGRLEGLRVGGARRVALALAAHGASLAIFHASPARLNAMRSCRRLMRPCQNSRYAGMT